MADEIASLLFDAAAPASRLAPMGAAKPKAPRGDKALGLRLRIARGKMSQKRLCELAGIDVSTLSRAETGKIEVSPEIAAKIAAVIGVAWIGDANLDGDLDARAIVRMGAHYEASSVAVRSAYDDQPPKEPGGMTLKEAIAFYTDHLTHLRQQHFRGVLPPSEGVRPGETVDAPPSSLVTLRARGAK